MSKKNLRRLRAIIAAILGLLPLLPIIVYELGLDSIPAVAIILTVSAAITRIVNDRSFINWWNTHIEKKEENNDED